MKNKDIVLSLYLQNYIIKILCHYYNIINQSFNIETLKPYYFKNDKDNEYYDNDYISNLILVNKYWMKCISNNINTIINFNNKINNKKLNIKQFINMIKPQPQQQSQSPASESPILNNNSSTIINNNNITTLVLDFTYFFDSLNVFYLVGRSKQFQYYMNNKLLEYPNLQHIKINNSSLQYNIYLANLLSTTIPIQLCIYSMTVARNEDGLDLSEEETKESLEQLFTKEELEMEDQRDLLSISNFHHNDFNEPLPLSSSIKVVNSINFIDADATIIFKTIHSLESIKHLVYNDTELFIQVYNLKTQNKINCTSLINLESYNFNSMSFKSLHYFLQLTPNLNTVLLRVCVDQINHIFMDESIGDCSDEFKSCNSCKSFNTDSNDQYWNSIYNHILNSSTIINFIFIHGCKGVIFGQPTSTRLSNGFQKIYNTISSNKQIKIFNIPFLMNK